MSREKASPEPAMANLWLLTKGFLALRRKSQVLRVQRQEFPGVGALLRSYSGGLPGLEKPRRERARRRAAGESRRRAL
jgi:hypothetical protein